MPRIFRDLFSIDIRSLAFFRIGLASVLLWDLADRANSLTAHYTDAGILPRAALTKYFSNTLLSFHMLGGGITFETILFLMAAFFAFMLLIGWHTRWVAVFSFILLFSLQQRNILILDAGDRLLRFLLMWSIFLPLGSVASIDAWRRQVTPSGIRNFSVASIALLLQPIMFYAVLTVSKLQATPWREGRALYSALNTAIVVRPLGEFLLAYPRLTEVLSYVTLGFEALIPIMLILPWWADRMRVGAIGLNFVLQGGMWLCLNIGELQPLTALALVPFIPTAVWNRAARFRLEAIPVNTVSVVSQGVLWGRAGHVCASVVAGLMLVYVIASNIASLIPPHYSLPSAFKSYGRVLQLNQRWRMFSNADATPQGWFLILGYMNDGTPIDIQRHDTGISLVRPKHYAATFQSSTWRNYWIKIIKTKLQVFRPYLVDYYCNQWNTGAPPEHKLVEVEVIHVYEVAHDPRRAKRVFPVRLIRKPCPLADI